MLCNAGIQLHLDCGIKVHENLQLIAQCMISTIWLKSRTFFTKQSIWQPKFKTHGCTKLVSTDIKCFLIMVRALGDGTDEPELISVFALWIRRINSPWANLTRVNNWKGQGYASGLVDQGTWTPMSDEEHSLKEYTSTSVCSQLRSNPN